MRTNHFNSHAFLLTISFALLYLASFKQKECNALPAIVSRATDSIAALLTSGRSTTSSSPSPSVAPQQLQSQVNSQQPQLIELQQQQQQQATLGAINNSSSVGNEQQQQQQSQQAIANPANNIQISNLNSNSLQAHLNAIQTQAQKQINHLNAAVLNGANQLVNSSPTFANLTQATGAKYGNMLEVLSNVGKAIHQQIMGSNGQIQIVTSPANGNQHHSSGGSLPPIGSDLANTKKVSCC